MSMVVTCTSCGKQLQAQSQLAGKTVRCPNCQQTLTIPNSTPPWGNPAPTPQATPGFGGGQSWQGTPGQPAAQPTMPQFSSPGAAVGHQPAKRGGSKKIWTVLGIVGMVIILPVVACCGGVFMLLREPAIPPTALEPFDVKSVAIMSFPERGRAVSLTDGIDLYQIRVGDGGGFGSPPGHNSEIKLYLPSGEHMARSLPCVLITGAGTPLFHGVRWGDLMEYDLDDLGEHLPYVEAGFAVIVYDMDGPLDEDNAEDADAMTSAYNAFRSAQAGVVNGRNAYEFILQRVPEVDPGRVYSAGHSSAGTASLLLASHEPRLSGAIAYAPCHDLPERLGAVGVRTLGILFDDFHEFAVQSSPKTHESRINCPVFLFHAEDDSNVPVLSSIDAHARMQAHGKDCTLVKVATGDHYFSMIEEGVPAAIEWLKKVDGKIGERPASDNEQMPQ